MTDDAIIQTMAHEHVDCGDGSTMGLRFIVALGLIEQSKMDDMQDELTREQALEIAYKAVQTSLRAALEAAEATPNTMSAGKALDNLYRAAYGAGHKALERE